jgi:hypothetical protein
MAEKRKIIIFAAFSALIAFAAFCAVFGANAPFCAEADGAPDLSSVAIESQPLGFDVCYGSGAETVLEVGLNYDNVVCTYVWYKGASPTGTYVAADEGSGTEIKYELTSHAQSGYYYCEITRVTYGSDTRACSIVSDRVKANLAAKPVSLVYADKKYVYDGTWQKLDVSVKAEDVVGGDSVGVVQDCDKAPVGAGVYCVRLSLDNVNYAIDGNTDAELTVQKAPLEISVADVVTKPNSDYETVITYKGFAQNETASVLGFTPAVADVYKHYSAVGVYDVYASGASESANYAITYPAGKIYVDKDILRGAETVGFTGTVAGMFRDGTVLTLTDDKSKLPKKEFNFLKSVYKSYAVSFSNGASDGDTFTVNFDDGDLSSFALRVCCVNNSGASSPVENFTYSNGILSVTVASDFDGYIVVYHDYTVIAAVGACIVLTVIILLTVIAKDKAKYRRDRMLAQAAKEQADFFRE